MVLNRFPDGVLIAAGKSERMGSWKMMLPFGGSTVIDRSLDTMLSVCRRVILVAGYRGEELEKHCGGRKRVQIVFNRNYEKGMFSSVRRGFKEVKSSFFFFGLGDMPMVREDTYRDLMQAAGLGGEKIEGEAPRFNVVIPIYNNKEGHPVLLSRAVAGKVAAEKEGEAGSGGKDRNGSSMTLRDVFATFEIQYVPVSDPGIVEDLDTAADYKAARLRNHGGTSAY